MDFHNVADNLRESFRVIAASRPPGEIRELRGVSIAAAGVTFQMFNAAFLSGPVANEAELSQRIMLPALHFDQELDDLHVREAVGGRVRHQGLELLARGAEADGPELVDDVAHDSPRFRS